MENIQEPKYCYSCGSTKPRDEFGVNKQANDGLNCWCRVCVAKKSREKNKRNSGKFDPVTEGDKYCSYKRHTLPVSCFGIDRMRPDGLQSICKECAAEIQRERRAKNTKNYIPNTGTKFCSGCGRVRPASDFGIMKCRHDGLNPHCKECLAKRHQEIREEILSAYSGTPPFCACCGETEIKFLSIDHINGGGKKERDSLQLRGFRFYRMLKRLNYPEGYRVLCHNCNQALGFYGMCPHEEKRRLEQNGLGP